MLILIALIAFLCSTIWSAILRSWPIALMGLGLTLTTLAHAGVIRIG